MLEQLKRYVKVHKLSCETRERTDGSCTCGFEAALVELEDIQKFVKLVGDMRTEKNYFKSRLQGDLRTSKLYEGDVDKLLTCLAVAEKQRADSGQKALL